ncbi:uncharacterized protein [Cicer arietinum]|uniref:Uncharacterized protein LOC113787222 isoform X1 n=1 Tax=Cicer arietinum TaxID=3827 RepID=A0A3Q7XEM3_CICAR|nr:uncharacterized protein LOC113787222 isoform X1 [Cicer arietinum]
MKFIYVLPEWEGTTSDSRILKDALSRVDPLKIPEELKARHTSKLSQYNHTVATIFVEYASARMLLPFPRTAPVERGVEGKLALYRLFSKPNRLAAFCYLASLILSSKNLS